MRPGRGERLAARARAGDGAAFAALVGPYDDRLRGLAFHLLGDRDLMDDVMQEAYLKALAALPRFRGRSSIATWLYRLTYNACLDELRRARRRPVRAPLDEAGEPRSPAPDPAELVSRRAELHDALMDLAPGDRAAVWLVDAVGCDYAAAAAVLDVPEGPSPRAAIHRSRDPISGELSVRRFRFAATAEGAFRLTDLTGPADVTYHANSGTEHAITTSASLGTGRFYTVRRGLAPGPPDHRPSDWILNRRLGAAVRALLAARDPAVTETSYDGREAWRVILPAQPNAIYRDVDTIEVTVDRATGIPVRVVTSLRGRLHDALRLRRLHVDDPLAPDTFELSFPSGAEVNVTDSGFRRVDLREAARIVPYAPLVPAEIPAGYRLAEVAVARAAAPTGAQEMNPPSRMVVSLTYRRAFDSFTVSTRLTGPDATRWDDPVATGRGIRERVDTVRLAHGALAGNRAALVLGGRSLPHLWTVNDELVVTVAGDLVRGELLAIAQSLRRTPRP